MNLFGMRGTVFFLDIVNIEKKNISVNRYYFVISFFRRHLQKELYRGYNFLLRISCVYSVQEDFIMLNEFKKFAIKGNVIDLAVGVIIGAAFGKIVNSMVQDMLMPLIGLLMGGIDFTGLSIKVGSEELKYGLFIQTVVDFFIISFSVFMFVRIITHFKRKEEVKEKAVIIDKKEELLMEIRDLLKERKENETSSPSYPYE